MQQGAQGAGSSAQKNGRTVLPVPTFDTFDTDPRVIDRARRAVLHALAIRGTITRRQLRDDVAPELRTHVDTALADLTTAGVITRTHNRYTRRP